MSNWARKLLKYWHLQNQALNLVSAFIHMGMPVNSRIPWSGPSGESAENEGKFGTHVTLSDRSLARIGQASSLVVTKAAMLVLAVWEVFSGSRYPELSDHLSFMYCT